MNIEDIEVIRNYNTDELEVHISSVINASEPLACIISQDGETVKQFKLLEGKNIIPLDEFLYKNYSVRITNKSNVVNYAL